MRSERPKPLHLLCGRAMLLYVLDSLADCSVDRVVVVVGHGAERVTKKLQDEEPDLRLEFVEQRVQRGTGDAVSVGLTGFPDDADADEHHDVLVLPGDTPLLRPSTIAGLVDTHRESGAACTILTGVLDDPTGYGRIVRGKDDRVARIVEELDATPEERAITEWNTSIYCFRRSVLAPALRRLQPQNAQGEYYLTDVVSVLHDAGYPVATVVADDAGEAAGINDRVQLAEAEAELRRRTNHAWLQQGRHDGRPGRDLRRRHRRAGRRRHHLPGRDPPGPHGRRAGQRGRSRHAAGRLHGRHRRRARPGDRPRCRDRRRARSSVPTRCCSPGASIPDGAVTGPFYTATGAE